MAGCSARKHVLVFRELPPNQLERLQSRHEVTYANPRLPGQLEAFHAALPTADGLIGSGYPFGPALLESAPRLKVISSMSAGVDSYDLPTLAARGIVLCHTADVQAETTADVIFLLIMASSRRLVELTSHVRDGHWTRYVGEDLLGNDVHGKTLGILGFGRIGKAVARRGALGFGMPVLYHSRREVDLTGDTLAGKATRTPLDELLQRADIVAAVLPLSNETRGFLGAREFGLMKPGAIFVNGGRGATVREDALLHALDAGTMRAAGLDVFAVEPLPLDSPLRRHAKVTALPHVGSSTFEVRYAMAKMATSNLLQALAGERPAAVYDMHDPARAV